MLQHMNGENDLGAARDKAKRVASWLVERSRPDEAVLLLSCWAVQGPNDEQGQNLLAEALRIDPSSKVAQQAFERMEGLTGTHDALDERDETGFVVLELAGGKIIARYKFTSIYKFAQAMLELPVHRDGEPRREISVLAK